MEHKSSIKFAKEKRARISTTVDFLKNVLAGYSNDFDFILDICDLIITSRSNLCFSYPLGYFLTSPGKLRFFEFIQADLEHSLDKLDEFTDKSLDTFIVNEDRGVILDREFFDFRSDALRLASVVKDHINKCLTEMEAGFPEVMSTEEDGKSNELLLMIINEENLSHWICPSCTYANEKAIIKCQICQTTRPAVSLR